MPMATMASSPSSSLVTAMNASSIREATMLYVAMNRSFLRSEEPKEIGLRNPGPGGDGLGGGAGIARSGELDHGRVNTERSPDLCALSDRYHRHLS